MPTVFEAFDAALELHRSGRLAEAEEIYRGILAVAPGHADAWHMLGMAALATRRPQEAVELVGRAIKLVPGQPTYHSNLGEVHRELGDLESARECFQEALSLDPHFCEAHSNLGLVWQAQGEFDNAAVEFERAIALRPDFVEAHYNLSRVLLLTGDFERGWREYSWRERMPGHPGRHLAIRLWDGSPLEDGRLLLYAEQGLGDTIQFIRFVPHARRLVAELEVAVPPTLVPLLSAAGFTNLVSQPGPLRDYSAQASLAALPGLFHATPQTIPCEVPYLRPEAKRVERWKSKLAAISGFKVGIAWQGNPAFYSDRFRSVRLAEFEPLALVPGVRLVSLQKGPGTEQLASLNRRFEVFALPEFDADGAFVDTAAIMTSLDLVVTSDTSIAHLAGALGIPVWVALPLSPDWRWLLERGDSPWYPSMRLFRQSRLGDWSDVFAEMAVELRMRSSQGNQT